MKTTIEGIESSASKTDPAIFRLKSSNAAHFLVFPTSALEAFFLD